MNLRPLFRSFYFGRPLQSQTHPIEVPTRGFDHVQLDEARKSEALLAAAEQLANLGSWRYDVASGKMAWSAQCYRMLGLDPRKNPATKELWLQTVHPEDRERVLEDFNKAITEGKAIDAEARFVLPDGRIRVNHTRATVITDLTGQVVRVAGVSQDITERKESEEKLRKSEALLAQAEQLANVGSWELDLKTGTIIWSDQMYRMLNLNPQGVSENVERFWQMVHPDDRERSQRREAQAIAEHHPFDSEVRCVFPDGRVRTIQSRALPVYDEAGQPIRLVGMAQDVTERKRAEEMSQKLSVRLLQLQDEERRRIARELHETTAQDLAGLRMCLGELNHLNCELPVSARQAIEDSLEISNRMIQEIRALSYSLHPPLLEETGLAMAVAWYAGGFSRRSGIEINVEIPDGFGRLPQEHETTLFRILQECLVNIYRHSNSRWARIHMTRAADSVTLEVEDRGQGMAGELRPSSQEAQELRVGIIGMHERVKQLHGVFEIESAPGRGTTVRAILPIPHADASSTAAGEAPKELKIDKILKSGQAADV
jgi:PAS domain S-box-containing protein